MRKCIFLAVALLILIATAAGAVTPAWIWVYRGTGDGSCAPNVQGTQAGQSGQESDVWYARALTNLGATGNWWMLENDNTYGLVTRIHHDGSAGTAFDWRGYGPDDAGTKPAQCATNFVNTDITKSYPAGTTIDDGNACALRIKVTAFGRGNESSTRQWGAQWHWPIATTYGKMGPRQNLGLVWNQAAGKIYVNQRENPTSNWYKICEIADQATQGGPVTNSKWVDIWCSVKRSMPGATPVDPIPDNEGNNPTEGYSYYCWYSYDGGVTWNEPIGKPNPMVSNWRSGSFQRFDINADGGTGSNGVGDCEYLMDYFAIANRSTDAPGAIAIPAKPAAMVDTTIGAIKSGPLGTPATFNGIITSKFTGNVPQDQTSAGNIDIYYVEQPDGVANPKGRENGTKVWISNRQSPKDISGNAYTPAVGDYVRVVGTLGKWYCEKMIFACSMQQQVKPQTMQNPGPLGTINKAVGSSFASTMSTFIPAQVPAGSPGKSGTNEHGLYTKVWGNVTYAGMSVGTKPFFYVDDGSGIVDGIGDEDGLGAPVKGIRVMVVDGSGLPAVNAYVSVTGSLGNTRVTYIDNNIPAVIDNVVPVVWMTGWQSYP